MTGEAEITATLNALEQGDVALEGLVPWGSNYTFLVRVRFDDYEAEAIYKPGKGERPLWDFTRGTLCLRERAAYLTSEALNWGLVPPTILRDGPHGWGSFQYYVDHDPQQHYLTIQGEYSSQLQRIAIFDALINNADRKSGHVLVGEGGRLWAIDHGVCFHQEDKLRSVIWEFAGKSIPETLIEDAVAFRDWLCYRNTPDYAELSQLLDKAEMNAMTERLEQLISKGTFPLPGPGRAYPWPLV